MKTEKNFTFALTPSNTFLEVRQSSNDIIFFTNNQEILKLAENGDIYVKGKLIENDKEVVEGLKEFLKI